MKHAHQQHQHQQHTFFYDTFFCYTQKKETNTSLCNNKRTIINILTAIMVSQKIYYDVGVSIKSTLRGIIIGMCSVGGILQHYNNLTFPNYTYYRVIYASLWFTAATQLLTMLLAQQMLPRFIDKYFDKYIKWMFELFLDFFSMAITLLSGAIVIKNCPRDTPVQQCFYTIFQLPMIATWFAGLLLFFVFVLTLIRK